MRAAVLRSVAVIGVGAVVLGIVLYVASTVDSRAPAVAAISLTQPLPDETDLGLITTSIEVELTEPIDTASADGVFRISPAVDGSVTWSGSTMIFTPAAPLEPDTTYTVELGAGIRDRAGNRMTELPEPFVFATAGPPEVVATIPSDGDDQVGLESPITIEFSTLMDTASVEAALRLRPTFAHELRWSGRVLEIAPSEPLAADRRYTVGLGGDASDVAGLTLGSPVSIAFRTISPGLGTSVLVPADGSDGISPSTPIAVVFDRAIDPASVQGAGVLTLSPDVAGSLSLVDAAGEPPADGADATVLVFTPSGPLPPSTTFEVELGTGVVGQGSGGLAEPIRWSFTTGTPQATLSNQVVYLSARAGIVNLWAMNPDGTAQRQVSTEITPVLDYAIAPDGSSFVVGDGRRLVVASADGRDRQVLTDAGVLEFDATYAPGGDRIAFARADAATGDGLGIWERPVPGGEATRIGIERAGLDSGPAPSGGDADDPGSLRAPRYSPDGDALAFVDLGGTVAIVDLASGDVDRADLTAVAPPLWLPNGAGVLVTGRDGGAAAQGRFGAPVGPLGPDGEGDHQVGIFEGSGDRVRPTAFAAGSAVLAVAGDGRIAVVGPDGTLRVTIGPTERGTVPDGLRGTRVADGAFAPGEDAFAAAVVDEAGASVGTIERIDLRTGDRAVLVNGAAHPRWLP